MQRQILAITTLIFCSLILFGCGPISNVDVGWSGATVDIVLHEDQVDRVLKRADMMVDDDGKSVLESITKVDFQEGHIEVEGTYKDDDGNTQIGRFDIEMGATDGALVVQITNVDIANVDPAMIEEANRDLAREFASEAEKGDVEFLEVTVTESELTMRIGVNF